MSRHLQPKAQVLARIKYFGYIAVIMNTKISHLVLLSLLYGCAPKTEATKCVSNFQGSGMDVRMTRVRTNSDGSQAYSIQLCGDAKPSPTVFTVYGLAANETSITDPGARYRLRHIEGSSHSGAQFEVDFRSYDVSFVIYQDAVTSTGYVLDTTNELIRGNLAQAEYAGGLVQ
jgi:hypothetical protein